MSSSAPESVASARWHRLSPKAQAGIIGGTVGLVAVAIIIIVLASVGVIPTGNPNADFWTKSGAAGVQPGSSTVDGLRPVIGQLTASTNPGTGGLPQITITFAVSSGQPRAFVYLSLQPVGSPSDKTVTAFPIDTPQPIVLNSTTKPPVYANTTYEVTMQAQGPGLLLGPWYAPPITVSTGSLQRALPKGGGVARAVAVSRVADGGPYAALLDDSEEGVL